VDDVDFSLVTGHGYGGSGMAPVHTRGSPGDLGHGGATPVGSDIQHRGAAWRQLEMATRGAR
jgi:hypothetical protein